MNHYTAEYQRIRRNRAILATYVLVVVVSYGYHFNRTCTIGEENLVRHATERFVCSVFKSVFWPVYWPLRISVELFDPNLKLSTIRVEN